MFFPWTQPRPPPSRWSSSPTPASSRAPGHLSSGSTWSVRTRRWDIPMTNTQHATYILRYISILQLWNLIWYIQYVLICVYFFQDVMFFANCPAATWPQFGELLSWQFLAATKRGLNDDQLEMIAHRLFGKFCIYVLL